jgi:hypothetical protein
VIDKRVPATHATHDAACGPEYSPDEQLRHAIAPSLSDTVPATQGLHAEAAAAAEYIPAVQFVHDAVPAALEEYVPTAHGMQTVA